MMGKPINYEFKIIEEYPIDPGFEFVKLWLRENVGEEDEDWSTVLMWHKVYFTSNQYYIEVPSIAIAIKDPQVSMMFRIAFSDRIHVDHR